MKKRITSIALSLAMLAALSISTLAAGSVISNTIPTSKNPEVKVVEYKGTEKPEGAKVALVNSTPGVKIENVKQLAPTMDVTAKAGAEAIFELKGDFSKYDLYLMHFMNNKWIKEPCTVKIASGVTTISAKPASFSPFVILAVAKAGPVSPNTGVSPMISVLALAALTGVGAYSLRKGLAK